MQATEQILEFDKIKNLWSQLALTQWTKTKISETTPILSESDLLLALRETTQSKLLIEKMGNPPLVSLEGIEEILVAAEKGQCLSPIDLETVEISLVAVKRIIQYLNRGKEYKNPIAFYSENLLYIDELYDAIKNQIRNGQVDDYASKLLLSIRNEITKTQEKMKEKADTFMRTNKEYMSDTFSTYRNGRLCVPVKKEYKFKISGSVIDKSATGNTLFMEPNIVAKYFDELQFLKLDEENEERRILYTLSAMVSEFAKPMRDNIKTIEKLDYMFSKGKLSLELDASEPQINTERRIILKDARHPLMDKNICVPLQFNLGNNVQGVVITGPNTGGKTVAIKTVALNCMMAQCGLHVAAKSADICMNSNYLCDIGDGQNLSENLSTFSSHINNILSILYNVTEDSLVIMDELGSGTDPTEGMGIAIAILEELRKSGCLFLVTTHYPEVKQYTQKAEGILNAKMTFDKESLCPLYQLVIGEAGESCAFYIASRLGMPKHMLETAASAAYGSEASQRYVFHHNNDIVSKSNTKKEKIEKQRQTPVRKDLSTKFRIGDSVLIYPEKKIGIVCEPVNVDGLVLIQLPNKKIRINHKRVKLHVAAAELYPTDYDFSIIFDTVENRKLRHHMERKYVEDRTIVIEE